MPSRNTLHHTFPGARSVDILANTLRNVLVHINGLSVTSATPATPATPKYQYPSTTMLVQVQSNTWSRAARRKRLPATVSADQESPVLRCSIDCRSMVASGTFCEIVFTWLEGKDRSIFESFTSHVNRKVTSTLQELGDG